MSITCELYSLFDVENNVERRLRVGEIADIVMPVINVETRKVKMICQKEAFSIPTITSWKVNGHYSGVRLNDQLYEYELLFHTKHGVVNGKAILKNFPNNPYMPTELDEGSIELVCAGPLYGKNESIALLQ